ncbi:MAG TPA: hypothetical protein VG848_10560, partial [Acetobacteraceae bacterium]|nr:hypothetical protein [Acetobacteraceae bacterium]
LIALYRLAIAEHHADPPDEGAIREAMQRFLRDALLRPSFDPSMIPAQPDARPNHIGELVAELIANQAELAALRSALEAAETSLAEAAAGLAAAEERLGAERTASRELLAAIHRSTSWRVTAPGRWLSGVLATLRHPSLRHKRRSSR